MRALGPPEPIGELDREPEPLEDQRQQASIGPEDADDADDEDGRGSDGDAPDDGNE
jgi:hypothetical protein